MFGRLLFFFLILIFSESFAQGNPSLKKLVERATSYLQEGAYKKARVNYMKAYRLSTKIHGEHHPQTLTILAQNAVTYTYSGNHKDALKILQGVLKSYKKNHPKENIAGIHNRLGAAYFFTQQLDSAYKHYQKALGTGKTVQHLRPANIHNNMAIILAAKEKYPQSIHHHKQALTIIVKHKGSKNFLVARSHNNIARTYTLAGNADSALYHYQQALVANTHSFGSQDLNNLPAKEAKFFSAMIAFETLHRKSELLKNSNMALKHTILADYLAKGIRTSLAHRSEKLNFLRHSGRFFESSLARIYQIYTATQNLETKQRMEQLFFYFSERSKANVLLDEIAQSNQQKQNERLITLPEVQTHLKKKNLAVISYVISKKTLYASIISGQGMEVVPVLRNTSRKQLRRIANLLRGTIQGFDVLTYLKEASKAFKKLLEKPLKLVAHEKNQKMLLLPPPELAGIPWEALPVKPLVVNLSPMKAVGVAEYLIKKYDVYYHFSATLAFRNPSATAPYNKTYLGLGIGDFSGKLPTLKQSISEVMGVAQILTNNKGFPKSQVSAYTNKEATKKMMLTRSKIIHLSTHGEYRRKNKSQLTGLFLAGSSPGSLDTLRAQDIRQHKGFGAELTILSGCHSRRGRIAQHEGVIGFERILIQKGVKYVLSSSWRAYDKPSKELLMLFFQYLDTKKWDYNRAWAKAKRVYLEKSRLPGTWAGLILIGIPNN